MSFASIAQTACPIVQAVSLLRTQIGARPVVLAFSGGMDSTVLLHELSRQKCALLAVYIHHGLQSVADDWLAHCRVQAENRQIPFCAIRVQVADVSRRGLEDRAREARYAALWQQVAPDGVLLIAHHQRDQAETFLLRALRGAGVSGLGAMRAWQVRDDGRLLLRPLLSVSYLDMRAYAEREGLTWIEDPSNQDDFALRNQIRNQLLPVMQRLQPQYAQQFAMAAHHAQEAQVLLNMVGQEDWKQCQLSRFTWDIACWQALPWIRAKNALMILWKDKDILLSTVQWQQIEQQFYAWHDVQTHPRFCWQGWCLLIDAGLGYFLPESVFMRPDRLRDTPLDQKQVYLWSELGVLSFSSQSRTALLVKPRQGGESLQTAQGTKTLKKWLQTEQLPMWQKVHWPVVYDAQSNVLLGWANMPAHWWHDGVVLVKIDWACPLEP